ncbi:HlyD family efflux transporter periplasmic adaptor subunit, partial [Methylobacterium nigriterrae]
SALSLMQATFAQQRAGPTSEERDIAKAKVELANAALAVLEARLGKTTLVAPSDGVVGLLVAEPGEAISPGQPVMTLSAASEPWFTFTIREDRL